MLLKELTKIMLPEDRLVVYDRFNRLIVIDVIEDIANYLMESEVEYLHFSTFHHCQAVKLKIGKFEC